MELKFDCLPCILRHTLESARMVTTSEQQIRNIMSFATQQLTDALETPASAPLITSRVQAFLKKECDVSDPYHAFKTEKVAAAQSLAPMVEKVIENSNDPLHAALLMAGMGNAIDAGVSLDIDIPANIEAAVKNGFGKSDYEQFRARLSKAKQLLYIADNTGEAVFDAMLIRRMVKEHDLQITYAVRDTPILNDITLEYAQKLGLNEHAKLISSGTTAPGMVMEMASQDFKEAHAKADVIISKGQGNLEGLYGVVSGIHFLLKAKCPIVADALGVKLNEFVFLYR